MKPKVGIERVESSLSLPTMGFGQVGTLVVLVSLLGSGLGGGESGTNARSTRTLASFFGRGNKEQPKEPVVEPREQQQQQSVVYPYDRPLVYQVKYYDTPWVREVGKNNIDKAGEVRQEQVQVGQQRVYYYTNPVVYPEAPVQYVQPYQQQPQQQPYVVQQQGQTAVGGVAQGYIYVNPVVGGGQPQAYVVSQVGNQQVLVPCPVDYNVGYNNYNVPVVQEKVPVVPVPVVKQQQQQQVVQQQQDAIIKGREQVYQQQGNKRQPTNVNVGVGGVVPEQYLYNPYGYGYGYGQYGGYGYNQAANPYVYPYYGYQYGYDSSPVVVGVVPPVVSPAEVTPAVINKVRVQQQVQVQPQQQQAVNGNPYVFFYRGGGGGVPYDNVSPYVTTNPYAYPYVVPVSGAVPKQPHVHHHPAVGVVDGSPSNRVSVSGQGQQVNPQNQQGVNQQQVVQQQQQAVAEAKKGTD